MSFAIYAHTNGTTSLIDDGGEFDPGYAVRDATVKEELNKAGTLEFYIYPQHPYFNQIIKMETKMWVIDDSNCIFYGRVLYTHVDINGSKQVHCEGAMSYLLDSLVDKDEAMALQTIMGTAGIINVTNYNKIDLTVRDFFKLLIALHNQQVDTDKRFTINSDDQINMGIAADGTSKKYTFELSGLGNSFDIIMESLIEKVGGYMRVRPVFTNGYGSPATLYIDWLKLIAPENLQTVEYGKNLVSFDSDESGCDLFTILIPQGIPTESGNDRRYHLDDDTIEDYLTPEKRDFDLEINGNSIHVRIDGKKMIITDSVDQQSNRYNHYGKIYRGIDIENIDGAATLYDKSVDYIKRFYDPLPQELSVTALDLYKLGWYPGQSPIVYGGYLYVGSPPHGINRKMVCDKLEHRLREPDANRYSLTSNINEEGDGIYVPTSGSTSYGGGRGSGGYGGGGGVGGTISDSIVETDRGYTLGLNTVNQVVLNTTRDFRIMARTLGFTTVEQEGGHTEFHMLPNGLVGAAVNDTAHNSAVVNLLENAFSITYGSTYIEPYDPESTYAVDDKVTHRDSQNRVKVYKCTTAINTPEAWDSSHWEEDYEDPLYITDEGIVTQFAVTNGMVKAVVYPPSPYTQKPYAVGDRVTHEYNGVLWVYECRTAIDEAEAWTASKWNRITPYSEEASAASLFIENVVEGINGSRFKIEADHVVINGQNNVTINAGDAFGLFVGSAEEYNPRSTYAVGDRVSHNGNVYACRTAITTFEEWHENKWTLIGEDTNVYIKTDPIVEGINAGGTGLIISADKIDLSAVNAAIALQRDRINLVVTGSGSSASIDIQAIVNGINTSAVTINANRIDLQGYVTATELSTGRLDAITLSLNSVLSTKNLICSGMATINGSATINGGLYNTSWNSGNSNYFTSHYHDVTASANNTTGLVTLTSGAPRTDPGSASFNMADTTWYAGRVSAFKSATSTALSNVNWGNGIAVTLDLSPSSSNYQKLRVISAYANVIYPGETLPTSVSLGLGDLNLSTQLQQYYSDAYNAGMQDGGAAAVTYITTTGWNNGQITFGQSTTEPATSKNGVTLGYIISNFGNDHKALVTIVDGDASDPNQYVQTGRNFYVDATGQYNLGKSDANALVTLSKEWGQNEQRGILTVRNSANDKTSVASLSSGTVTWNGTVATIPIKDGSTDVTNFTVNASSKLETKSATPTTSEQTLEPSSGNIGFSSVTVGAVQLETKTIDENGTYTPTSGKMGFSSVVVNVPASNIDSLSGGSVSNSHYDDSKQYWYGTVPITVTLEDDTEDEYNVTIQVQEPLNTGVGVGWEWAASTLKWPDDEDGTSGKPYTTSFQIRYPTGWNQTSNKSFYLVQSGNDALVRMNDASNGDIVSRIVGLNGVHTTSHSSSVADVRLFRDSTGVAKQLKMRYLENGDWKDAGTKYWYYRDTYYSPKTMYT